ncbi:MAG: sigma-70 family RNA polymerase sigma factor, partial [Saprospiraceae bacterium]|nr:sigma-70 family RNA polymerase sigma factor [Saprospiraceae bacterium]
MRSPTQRTDEELVADAAEGDDSAFREIVARHERLVRSTVAGMLGYRPEVDDVAQEVFIRFYRSLDQFRGDAKLSSYLCRIAINLTLNEIKSRKSRLRVIDPECRDNRQQLHLA